MSISDTALDKVIPIGNGRKRDSSSMSLVQGNSATIHTLTDNPSQRIFWERDTSKYSSAPGFFRVLFSYREVSIRTENAECITPETILNVIDKDNSEYEITAQQLVQLTANHPDRIGNIDNYVVHYFFVLDIQTSMRIVKNIPTKTELSEEEIETYHPESISGHDAETGDFYSCEFFYSEDAPVGYGDIESFDTDTHHITLLDLILSATDDAEINNIDLSGASLKVVYYQGDETIITHIPSHLIGTIIYNALKRINPLYQNMNLENARNHYFFEVTVPKLRGEY